MDIAYVSLLQLTSQAASIVMKLSPYSITAQFFLFLTVYKLLTDLFGLNSTPYNHAFMQVSLAKGPTELFNLRVFIAVYHLNCLP
jgi:hypothetical protein